MREPVFRRSPTVQPLRRCLAPRRLPRVNLPLTPVHGTGTILPNNEDGLMKYAEADLGRVFVLRLEQDEILHETIERFARDHSIRAAAVLALGGADAGSTLVVGPEDGRARPVTPMARLLDNVHEMAGVGTIFPDDSGAPVLHMHAAAGRTSQTTTGCVRSGVKTWVVAEVVIFELLHIPAIRKSDPAVGFKLLDPTGGSAVQKIDLSHLERQ
jgi:predicted DNA-binding protein with PD1-like motif